MYCFRSRYPILPSCLKYRFISQLVNKNGNVVFCIFCILSFVFCILHVDNVLRIFSLDVAELGAFFQKLQNFLNSPGFEKEVAGLLLGTLFPLFVTIFNASALIFKSNHIFPDFSPLFVTFFTVTKLQKGICFKIRWFIFVSYDGWHIWLLMFEYFVLYVTGLVRLHVLTTWSFYDLTIF